MFKTLVFLFLGLLTLPASAAPQPAASALDSGYGVSCGETGCPESVGIMVSKIEGAWIQCSFTLIDADHVLTNAHCIPEHARTEGALCNEWAEILFPKGPLFAEERLACDRIEKISQVERSGDEPALDFAILKLRQKTKRRPAKVLPRAIGFGETVTGYAAQYNPFFAVAMLQKITCKVGELSYLHPLTLSPTSPQFFVTDCDHKIIGGNSGTSFFDASGNLIGLLHAFTHQASTTSGNLEAGTNSGIAIKALCITGNSATCAQDPEDPELQTLAIELSVLRSFAEKPASRTSKGPAWLKAEIPSIGRSETLYPQLYPYSDFAHALKVARANGFTAQADELRGLAQKTLGILPRCFTKRPTEVSFPWTYRVLNFHSSAIYPNDQGQPFLSLREDMSLDLSVAEVEVQLQIEDAGAVLKLKHVKSAQTLALTGQQTQIFEQVCRDEEKNRRSLCEKTAGCDLKDSNLRVPSPVCQSIYRQNSLRHYLPDFEIEIPACQN